MLRELKVRDLALVAESRVRFGPGLNLLTGETGSGKSLIVDALGLTLGERGGADQVRHGADKAIVEGVFESGSNALVLQRELGKRGAARIDGRPANPGQLRELGRGLVAMHGQHEHHALLDADTQTELLDGYAGAIELRAAVAAAHAEWTRSVAALSDLDRLRSRGQKEQEYLRWQLEELRAADPRPGEDTDLAAEREAVRHAARLAELSHACRFDYETHARALFPGGRRFDATRALRIGLVHEVVEGIDGRTHHLRFSDPEMTGDAQLGAIVEARAYEDAGGRKRLSLATRSDLPLEAQVTAPGATWIDRQLSCARSADERRCLRRRDSRSHGPARRASRE